MLVLRILIVVAGILPILAGCSKSEVKAGKSDVVELRLKQRTLYEKHFLERSSLSAEQIQELSAIHSNVLQTTQNGYAGDLKDSVFAITNHFHGVQKWNRPLFESVLERIFYESAFSSNRIEGFRSAEVFDAYLEYYSDVAVMLGQSRLRTYDYGYEASSVEALVFHKLKQYCEHYRKVNEPCYERVAEKHLERWLDFIESNEGISQCAARRLFVYEKERVEKLGDTRYENALRAVRSLAQGLVHCGYTPRWLDEEFPLPTENGTAKDGDK